MAARGHALEIVTPAELWPGLDPRLNPILLPLAVRRWLRRRPHLDLVLLHSYLGSALPRARRARAATMFHGLEPIFHRALEAEAARRRSRLSRRYALMYGRVMPRMLKRACRNSDLVFCLNGQERDLLVSEHYAAPDRIELTWHDAPDDVFEAHDYRAEALTLLAVMQWLPAKGTRDLVDAFTRVAHARPRIRLTVAGTLLSVADVRASFPEDVRARVDVIPVFDRPTHRALLARADLFVHSSLSEGFSRAVIEALAAGVPVISTRTGFAIDRVSDGIEARVVPPAEPLALAAAIEQLAGDVDARTRLGVAGQAFARRLRQADSTGTLLSRLEQLVATGR